MFEDLLKVIDDRIQFLSSNTQVVKEVNPKQTGKQVLGKKLNVEVVLQELFKMALRGVDKGKLVSFDNCLETLVNETLDLFEHLEGPESEENRPKMNPIPSRTYRALDAKVGSKLAMAESKAWTKVSSICSISQFLIKFQILWYKSSYLCFKKILNFKSFIIGDQIHLQHRHLLEYH